MYAVCRWALFSAFVLGVGAPAGFARDNGELKLARDVERYRGIIEDRWTSRRTTPQVVGYMFDVDDNLWSFNTQIYLFHRKTGEERAVSTGEFATIWPKVGKPGAWKDFVIDRCPRKGSYRNFRDFADPKAFEKDHLDAIRNGRFALSYHAMLAATDHPETARWTSLNTSRGNGRKQIYGSFLRNVWEPGNIDWMFPEENIYPIGDERLVVGGVRMQDSYPEVQRKFQCMIDFFDSIQRRGLGKGALGVLAPDGKSYRPMHLVGFSEDMPRNFKYPCRNLHILMSRWPDLKITLYYTGVKPLDKHRHPHAVVLLPDGSSRPQTAEERREARLIVRSWGPLPSRAGLKLVRH